MKQKILKWASFSLACLMSATFFASCGHRNPTSDSSSEASSTPISKKYSNEDDALVFSSGEFDKVFNPFFSTSAYDSTIAGQTQISMLSSDPEGKTPLYGKDQPVVTLDYSETMYDRYGKVTQSGDQRGTTVYQMVLKNGILFSDGEPLTAHDVLFNMYMYLDPVYSGSSTMYSTDIQGLRAYQSQDPNAEDKDEDTLTDSFNTLAKQRISIICTYVTNQQKWSSVASTVGTYNSLRSDWKITEQYDENALKKDIEAIKKEWKEELTSDWSTYASDLESYQKEYPFTEGWQVYFYNEGLISRKSKTVGGVTTYEKDSDGKYVIEWKGIDKNANYEKDAAIEMVYNSKMTSDEFIAEILVGGWATGSTMKAAFAGEDRSTYFKQLKEENNGKNLVKSISGIKILNGSQFKPNGAKKYEEDYGDYEMLQVTINGVDPKAKWNFAFSVAPMHYYSTPELTKAAMEDTEYDSNFGVQISDIDFMNQVKRRNLVPMGAGMYRASTMYDYTYEWSTDAGKEQASFEKLSQEILKDNVAYFVRNENFYTTGGNTKEVYNAKIKHIRYKVVNSANTMTALQGESIHFADPSASTENVNTIDDAKNSYLSRIMVKTAGYGYIGINAEYIQNIYVRRAIMSVMNIDLVKNYYPSSLSEAIYRPFSKVSWVYEADKEDGLEAWEPKSYYGYDESFETGKKLLQEGGCTFKNGKWYDKDDKALKYTFTIAGDTTDHPAYATLLKAREILNKNGWEVEVIPDARALYKLASGSLAVWAAAWSASLDPDMYQVYHKDSKATSVNNWGYDWIKDNKTDKARTEWNIIEELSTLIEEGRETIVQSERARTYRAASDLVMDLAVELPLYQRSDMYVYNNTILDGSTFYAPATPYASPLNEMWKISFKQ